MLEAAEDGSFVMFLSTLHPHSHGSAVCTHCRQPTDQRYIFVVVVVCSCLLWNTLPISVRSADTLTCFRSRLKTYPFSCHVTGISVRASDCLFTSVTTARFKYFFTDYRGWCIARRSHSILQKQWVASKRNSVFKTKWL